MPVVARIVSDRTSGYQARIHKTCGPCKRPWCCCHRKATRFFADKKYGGEFMSLQLARQWCRDAWRENVRAAGKVAARKRSPRAESCK